MQPPRFWQTSPYAPGLAARALAPLGALYAAATARRVARAPRVMPGVPVICVGNLNVGGTGKTPTVMALVERLSAQKPHIVSRGYGGALEGPVRVDERRHRADEVGDEPLLLSAFAPTWIAKDRAEGARAAEAAGAGVILLDDGFQNPDVAKTASIVVVDAAHGFGNGRVLPAGPLREPVAAGLRRADLLLSIGDAAAQTRFTETWGDAVTCPRATAELRPLETGMDWSDLRAFAFAGIGHPDRFFATLRGLGATLAGSVALDDHQPLTDALMARLEADAAALSARLVTTEKDAVRLPPTFRRKVLTLPVRLVFTDDAALTETLDRALA